MKNKKVTIKEIAERTGVSIGTVHRAIYGKEGVSEATRKRILDEVEKMDYHIDEAASSLKRKILNIAVVMPKACGEERFFLRGVWQGIKEVDAELGSNKVHFQYIESDYGLYCISDQLRILYDTMLDDIDGLITISDSNECNDWIARFHKQGITVILIASNERVEHCFCSVKVDHKKAGKLAAEFLKTSCHGNNGKILVLTGDEKILSNQNYATSFTEQFGSDELIKVKGFGKEEIYDKCRQLLLTEPIKAVFTCNARNTYVLCQLLKEEDMKSPVFVGTDVFYELEPFFEENILNASICQHTKEQGRRAAEILYRYLVTGSREKNKEVLPIGIVMKSNYEYYIC